MEQNSNKISKEDVQCIGVYDKPHVLHETWMHEVSSRKIIPFVPKSIDFVRNIPILSQIVSLVRGIFIPSAKVYFVEGVSSIPAVIFKRGKIICLNSDTFFYLAKKSIFAKLFGKLFLWKVDGFISTSKMMVELQRGTGKPSEIAYPYMNKNELFKIKPDFKSSNIFLIGARYEKGTDVVIDVFKKLKEKIPDTTLTVIGRGDYYIKKVKEVGGYAPGFQADVAPYFKKAGIYINLSRHDSFGINILESMASGIPPFISDRCGAKDVIKKIDKRLIVPLNPDEIVKRITWLKSDRKRFDELSRKCRKEAAKFTKEKSVREFKEKFYKLIGRV